MERSQNMELAIVVGIDETSEGLAMAREHGIAITHEGLEGLRKHPIYKDIGIAFDATTAYAHKVHDQALRADGIQVVDLTPAAIGPFTVPPVNMEAHLDHRKSRLLLVSTPLRRVRHTPKTAIAYPI